MRAQGEEAAGPSPAEANGSQPEAETRSQAEKS
jgi:hypothetical protein